MPHLSKTAGYAVHALSFIGTTAPESCFVGDVALALGLPKPYLAQIVNQLMHEGLVTTKRGYLGGVGLARRPEEISLLEVVRAVEGDQPMSRCVFGLEKCCVNKKCPAHVPWNRMRKQIVVMLGRTMLSAVMESTALAQASKSATRRATAARRL